MINMFVQSIKQLAFVRLRRGVDLNNQSDGKQLHMLLLNLTLVAKNIMVLLKLMNKTV